ncbi:MAG TPA: hypothetical protein VFP98_05685, partial [Candidatus Polarisedimenticolia bacterium]|nr:hypothetical protein [Candidatus Polarisedimenticolia bacterium]
MTSPQSLFVISSRSAFVTEARQAASRSGMILIAGRAELAHGGTAPAALDALRSDAAGALLLDLDSDIAEALRFLQEACRTVPDARVLAASSNRS